MDAPKLPDDESFVVSRKDIEEIVDTAIRAHEEEAQKAISIHKPPVHTGTAVGAITGIKVSSVVASGVVAPACVPVLAAPLLACLLYTSPSPRDRQKSRMPSSA